MTKEKLFLYSPIVQARLIKFLEELELISEGTSPVELILAGISSMYATASLGEHKEQMKHMSTVLSYTPDLFGLIMQEYTPGENHEARLKQLAEATGEDERFLTQLPLSHLTDEEFANYVSLYQQSVKLHEK